jgi:DNA-directed RNA polymerase specialized sigma24 family protein
VEVLRRTSNNFGVVQRVNRLVRHLEQQGRGRQPKPPPRPAYQPHRLSRRLSDETVSAILDAYLAGATTREVGERLGLAHSSVNKLLKQHGVRIRRRGAQEGSPVGKSRNRDPGPPSVPSPRP